MFSKIFIDRPKLAFVLSILISLAGILCIRTLPVADYPEIAPPCIYVWAKYPGASAQVMTETVASIIEEQANGIENMIYYQSESGDGQYFCFFYFEPGSDSDIDLVNVQNAIQRAEPQLPTEVKSIGIRVAVPLISLGSITFWRTRKKCLNWSWPIMSASTLRTSWPGCRESVTPKSSGSEIIRCGFGWIR
jgi:multidrug efflux pump subunit AcrB